MKNNLLIIEDEPVIAKQMKWGLNRHYDVVIANTLEKTRELLKSNFFPVATLDLGMPPSPNSAAEGLKFLEELPNIAPNTKIIVITGNRETENAVRAVNLGAADFFSKPINLDVFKIILDRTFRIQMLETSNRILKSLKKRPAGLSEKSLHLPRVPPPPLPPIRGPEMCGSCRTVYAVRSQGHRGVCFNQNLWD